MPAIFPVAAGLAAILLGSLAVCAVLLSEEFNADRARWRRSIGRRWRARIRRRPRPGTEVLDPGPAALLELSEPAPVGAELVDAGRPAYWPRHERSWPRHDRPRPPWNTAAMPAAR